MVYYTGVLLFRNVVSTYYYSWSSLGIGTRQIRAAGTGGKCSHPGTVRYNGYRPKIFGIVDETFRDARVRDPRGHGRRVPLRRQSYDSITPPCKDDRGWSAMPEVDLNDCQRSHKHTHTTADFTGSASSYRTTPTTAVCCDECEIRGVYRTLEHRFGNTSRRTGVDVERSMMDERRKFVTKTVRRRNTRAVTYSGVDTAFACYFRFKHKDLFNVFPVPSLLVYVLDTRLSYLCLHSARLPGLPF